MRAEKTVNGVKHEYYYVDGLLKTEKIGDDYEMYYRYDTNGVLASVTRYTVSTDASSVLYAQTNTRGDVISLYDGDGATRVKYVYDSWGKLISATDGNGNALAETAIGSLNSIRYRGYVYDSETGLYYLLSRYYDPKVGRFINADSVDCIGYSGETLSYNMFAYCENNGVNCADYSGESLKDYNYDSCYYFGLIDSAYYFWFYVYKINKFIGNVNDNVFFAQLAVTKNNVKVWICYLESVDSKGRPLEKNIQDNKKFIKNFVVNDVCIVLSHYLLGCYKSVYNTNKYKYRTVKGIELEIVLHLYMYYFDIDKNVSYSRSSCIDIDNHKGGNGRKIENYSGSPILWITLCKNAIKNGKENKIVTTLIRKFI